METTKQQEETKKAWNICITKSIIIRIKGSIFNKSQFNGRRKIKIIT